MKNSGLLLSAVRLAIMLLLTAVAFAQEPAAQPRLLEAVAPLYPMVAVYSDTSSDVVVNVIIGKDGSVTAAKAVSGHPVLYAAAEAAAKKWRFAPGDSENEAKITFTFRIMPKATPQADLATRFLPQFHIEIRRTIPEATSNTDPAADRPKRVRKP